MRFSRAKKPANEELFHEPEVVEPKPADDEMAAMLSENSQLKSEVQFLNDHQTRTAETLEHMQRAPFLGYGVVRPEMLVLILVVLLGSRFAIFKCALMPVIVSQVADGLFGLIGLVVLFRWLSAGWAVERWMVIPRGSVIFAGIFIAGSLVTGGSFLIAKRLAKVDVTGAAIVMLVLLLVGASPLCRLVMVLALKILDVPNRRTNGLDRKN